MNIIINCKHMDLTPNLKSHAEEKVSKFKKYLGNASEATVTLSVEKYRHKAEILLKVNGSFLQAESITEEMYASIDEVIEKLARQVKKHKDKIVSMRKQHRDNADEIVDTSEELPSIIKNKSYDIKPMGIEEAAMQMDLMSREFLVFTNSSSGSFNVLYKRNDGNFGLIEPLQ
ncbi:MAG: ribosome-associated translation inhibitor RaiA [Nitrospira sp.]|nr:ribosome-associated translation inhibitor RaiA [bacterium]MBL7049973.1 ribosome-associated translation inhibitor RaiA [Nitrospira sp.]